eukprot:CAMPEP_0195052022 /NCGR_PEP_ID=MMETSP0448-20130528/1423_1 /TAXON_ID=66468 /ORGANISM="Heterocapsa triquestra, Strain CCMP 448" /LENGTH=59 /DNA_ID=CAMNT_0040081089 /DNA_START=8 /DNA_END=183 /DNA_ORIENTATION=-
MACIAGASGEPFLANLLAAHVSNWIRCCHAMISAGLTADGTAASGTGFSSAGSAGTSTG